MTLFVSTFLTVSVKIIEMKKILLLVGLVVFLTPMFASADEVKLSCKCFKHEFKHGGLFGYQVPSEYQQCSMVNEIWIIDLENMTIHNTQWKDWGWSEDAIRLPITSNSQNQISAGINDVNALLDGLWKVDIQNSNNKRILKFLWKQKPNKKKSAFIKYSSNCEELQTKKKVDPFEAKQQLCEKLGFPIGSQENGNCVLKIFEIESNLKQKEESAGGQLTEADKLIRQQRLNQSLMLMQQGLKLMSPPQPKLNCRNTITGWACY